MSLSYSKTTYLAMLYSSLRYSPFALATEFVRQKDVQTFQMDWDISYKCIGRNSVFTTNIL